MTTVAIIASLDTKAEEADYLRKRIEAAGVSAMLVDFGTGQPAIKPHIEATTLARLGGVSIDDLRLRRDRAAAIDVMIAGAANWAGAAHAAGSINGIVSIGGSGGTAVGTSAMRALPFGVPKVMVSTVASADVRPYVGLKDVTMINSVVDFAGLNPISEAVLRNAAAAVAAMAKASQEPSALRPQRLVAATQFGVTTPAIETAHRLLGAAGFTLVPFHATGIGGQTMETLIDDGFFEAVLDLTTTEWADEVVGGTLSAGPTRLEAAARAGIPQVIVPGALDMVNFFGAEGVPLNLAGRRIHHHNANVALMRTTAQECTEIGQRIAEKLNAATGPVAVLFPLKGVSALDAAGQDFYDPVADQALFDALERNLEPRIALEGLDLHINDDAFAAACVTRLLNLIDQQKAGAHA